MSFSVTTVRVSSLTVICMGFYLLLAPGIKGVNYDDRTVHVPVTRHPIELDKWAALEISLMDKIKSLQTTMKKSFASNKALNSYIKDFKESVQNLRRYKGSLTKRVKAVTSNPVATFRFIRRIVNDLPELKLRMKQYDELFEDFPRTWPWLTYDDLDDAMLTIIKINYFYNLDAESVSNGVIGGIPTGAKLDAVHCHEIAIHAGNTDYLDLAIEWSELALKKTQVDQTVSEASIRETLEDIITKHDVAVVNHPFELYPHVFDRQVAPMQYQSNSSTVRLKRRDVLIETYGGHLDMKYLDINFLRLCSSTLFQHQKEIQKSSLYCWYERSRHPYWYLSPLKMEMLAENPSLLQVYDILSERRIKRLQDLASEYLFQSEILNMKERNTGTLVQSETRSSVQAFIDEMIYLDLAALPLIVEKITGLHSVKATSSEHLQVASYTPGGHFNAHVDAVSALNTTWADERYKRIATVMFYLQEPELGGETVFIDANVVVRPTKGSGLFWYGLYSDGEVDRSTNHGACPVILGRKWVANKWIFYDDQFLARKCGLRPKERYVILANNTSS